ncbi:MAG: glycosyltransferase family 4 protein [Bdellovibrionaceae bacterium]|nr:glycosyltransferase family 4 protein [Bdellovibrionales bacterium]MCB9255242.1 glycosyltransferase family 4 protein [Pseudobdellovibrionaceae bacterium]
MGIAVNGRFRSQNVTGVQRYATEITSRLGDKVRILEPDKPKGRIAGHAWEQFVLPQKVTGELLWSPGNTGPLSVPSQVLTLHDLSFIDFPKGYSKAFLSWYRWLIPRLVKRVRHLITVSEFSKQRIESVFSIPANKISVIPEAAGPHFKPQADSVVQATLAKLKLSHPYLLCIGGDSRRKNFISVAKVWPVLSNRFKDVDLVVVGSPEGVYRKNRLPKLPRLKVLPHVEEGDLPALYQGARCFVYPSLYEGFGLPILEAMACGTPVVASNSSSLPEVGGQAALWIPPLSSEKLNETLARILESSALRRELQEKGLQHAARFSWDTVAQTTYQTLLRNV